MTDKIIVDGVDVKDCKRRIGKNSYCRYFKRPCSENNFNCIWKQHERLKQEHNIICYNLSVKENEAKHYLEESSKYRNTLQEIKTLVTTDYIQIKRQLVQNYDCLDNFLQKIAEKCEEVL